MRIELHRRIFLDGEVVVQQPRDWREHRVFCNDGSADQCYTSCILIVRLVCQGHLKVYGRLVVVIISFVSP